MIPMLAARSRLALAAAIALVLGGCATLGDPGGLDALERGIEIGRRMCVEQGGGPAAPTACAPATAERVVDLLRQAYPQLADVRVRPNGVSSRARTPRARFGLDFVVRPQDGVLLLVAHDLGNVGQILADDTTALRFYSQVTRLNYELLLGKYQVNPRTGDVLYTQELYIRDGLCPATFNEAVRVLLANVDARAGRIAELLDPER